MFDLVKEKLTIQLDVVKSAVDSRIVKSFRAQLSLSRGLEQELLTRVHISTAKAHVPLLWFDPVVSLCETFCQTPSSS